MSARKYVTIWCDNTTDGAGCVRFLETEHHTAKRARHTASREGWISARCMIESRGVADE